jgi:hypothetical protein
MLLFLHGHYFNRNVLQFLRANYLTVQSGLFGVADVGNGHQLRIVSHRYVEFGTVLLLISL